MRSENSDYRKVWYIVSRSRVKGLGVRCLGAITRERLEAVRESDAILREEFAKSGLDKKVWQYFTVVPDFKAVGVRNNARSMGYMVVIQSSQYDRCDDSFY